jgi:quercetin dioxygenase-like cupin family protein
MKYGKVWGETRNIFNKNNVSVNRIVINKNTMCSKHYHAHKTNVFFVESGLIKIQVWQNDYDLLDETVLSTGEMMEVRSGIKHRFIGLEDSIIYEIYYVELDEQDIIRDNCGSKQVEP